MKPPNPLSAGRPGSVKSITSASNPAIKFIRGLVGQRKHRRQSGLFVAEGLKLAADALEAGWEVDAFVYGADAKGREPVDRAAATVHARGGAVLEVTHQVLSAVTRRDNPQTVFGVYRQRTLPAEKIKPKENAVWIGLDQIRDPGNLGTIIRTADASGAAGVMLIGESTDPFAVEAVRATMGSIFHVPIVRLTREQFIDWIKKWPGRTTGCHLAGDVDYRQADYGNPCFLLMGNEQSGLPPEMAETCDMLVKIPQAGQADSLNLAVAAGVMLFEINRDRLKL